jgi:hypothetical protein
MQAGRCHCINGLTWHEQQPKLAWKERQTITGRIYTEQQQKLMIPKEKLTFFAEIDLKILNN